MYLYKKTSHRGLGGNVWHHFSIIHLVYICACVCVIVVVEFCTWGRKNGDLSYLTIEAVSAWE